MQPDAIPPPSASDEGETESAPIPASEPSTLSRKKIREMKLRADKLADVRGPTLVHCLNCGAAIKLSHKSEYDASHWLRHRARCVKRSKAREVGRATQPRSSVSSASGSSPALSARALTPQDDDVEEDTEPDIDSPHAFPADFLVWQSWDWSQLKPRFFPLV